MRLAKWVLILLFWVISPVRSQVDPALWVDHFYGPMEHVFEQVERLPEVASGQVHAFDAFIQSDTWTEAYFEGFLASDMGVAFQNQNWIRNHFRIIVRQWRAIALHLPPQVKSELWNRAPRHAGVMAETPVQRDQVFREWSVGGAEQWLPRRELIRAAMETRLESQPFSLMQSYAAEGIAALRVHAPIGPMQALRADAQTVMRIIAEGNDLIELDRLADPSLLPTTLNHMAYRWVVRLTERYRLYAPEAPEADLRALAAAVVQSARDFLHWPTDLELRSWIETPPVQTQEWRLFKLPRRLYAGLTEGFSAAECASGGLSHCTQLIHPEEYALIALPGARSAVLISQESNSGRLRFRGTANLYALATARDATPLFSFHSRLQNQEIGRIRNVMSALLELMEVDAIAIEGNYTRVDNSAWSRLLREHFPSARMLMGRMSLVGFSAWRRIFKRLTQEGSLSSPPPTFRLLGAGITAGTVPDTNFVIKLDRATLARGEQTAQGEFAQQWLHEIMQNYDNSRAKIVSDEMVVRFVQLGLLFEPTRATVVQLIRFFSSRLQIDDPIQLSLQRAAGRLIRESTAELQASLLPILLNPFLIPGISTLRVSTEELTCSLDRLAESERQRVLDALRSALPRISDSEILERINLTLRIYDPVTAQPGLVRSVPVRRADTVPPSVPQESSSPNTARCVAETAQVVLVEITRVE